MNDLRMLYVEYRISMLFLLIFLFLFLHLRYRKWISGAIALVCFGITAIMEYAIFFGNLDLETELVLTVLEIIVVQATAYILSLYRDGRALFTGISSATYVLTGNVFYMGVTAFWGASPVILILAGVLHLVLLLITTGLLRTSYLSVMESYAPVWNRLCLIPALFYAVTYTLTCWPSSIYETRENWLAVFLILLLMDATYVLIIKVTSQQKMENELERSREFLETYAEGLRKEAAALQKSEEKIRVLRHDSRHVYQMIRIYLEEGKTEQIEKLLDQLDLEIEPLKTRRFCENITINGILSAYAARAEKEEVGFVCRADVTKELESVNEFELGTVISNLLENAIDAAKEVQEPDKRRVIIRIFPVKRQLMLEIINTFTGTYEYSGTAGLMVSTKGKGHGYGLRSVRAYADKHHAIFRCSVEKGQFYVRLLTDR